MRNKWMKRMLLAGAAGIAAGGILLGAGTALGGSASFYYDGEGFHVKENTPAGGNASYTLENTLTGELKELDICLEDADLEIVSGNDWAVEYVLDGNDGEPVYEVKDGTLVLEEGGYVYEEGYRFSFGLGGTWMDQGEASQKPYVRLAVPEGERLEKVKIENSYGKILVEEELAADFVSILSQDGEVCLEGWNGKELELDLEYGFLETGELEGEAVDISSADGRVEIGGIKAETAQLQTEYGELAANVSRGSRIYAESEDGTVELSLEGGMEEYEVSLHSEYGSIRIPSGRVEEDEEDGGSDFISGADAGRKGGQEKAGIIVYTQYGDIRIRER